MHEGSGCNQWVMRLGSVSFTSLLIMWCPTLFVGIYTRIIIVILLSGSPIPIFFSTVQKNYCINFFQWV